MTVMIGNFTYKIIRRFVHIYRHAISIIRLMVFHILFILLCHINELIICKSTISKTAIYQYRSF